MKSFCLPFLAIVWGGTIIFFASFSVLIYDTIDDNYCLRNQTMEADKKYYNDLCLNVTKKSEYNLWTTCLEKEHSLHKPVYRLAMVDTAKQYGLCYGIRCEDFLLKSVYLIPMIFTSITIVVIVLLMCGCTLFSYWYRYDTRHHMPTLSGNPEKNMDNGYSARRKSWFETKHHKLN